MNLDTLNLVLQYYKAIWQYFDPKLLPNLFHNNITTFHVRRGEECYGIENVMNSYKRNFFSTVDLGSTKIYDFHILPLCFKDGLEHVTVSYTLEQTHSDRGKTFGHVTETFKIFDGLIYDITMNSTFQKCI